MPMSSVVVDLYTYMFTAITSTTLTVTAVAYLLVSAFRRTDYHISSGIHWTSSSVYNWLMVSIAITLATVIPWRLSVMELTMKQISAKTFANPESVYQSHMMCVSCATVLAVAALLKLTKPQWPSSGRPFLATTAIVISILYYISKTLH